MADSDAAICNLALLKIGNTKNPIQILSATSDDQTEDGSEEQVACKLLYPQKRDELLRAFRWPWAQRRAYPTQLGGTTYSATAPYNAGDYVSFAPDQTDVANPPESLTTFVYLALQAVPAGNDPDDSPTYWRQISRAEWAYCFLLPSDIIQIHGLYHGIRNAREDQEVPYELAAEPSPGPGTILLTDAGLPYEAISSTNPVSIEIKYTAQITDTKQFPADFTDALAWALAVDLALALRKDGSEAERCAKAAAAQLAKAVANASRERRRDPPPVPSWIAARRGRSGF